MNEPNFTTISYQSNLTMKVDTAVAQSTITEKMQSIDMEPLFV